MDDSSTGRPDHSKLTPAQEREARRRLRRALGEGTPDEQAARLMRKAFEDRAKVRLRREVSMLGRELVNLLFGFLGRK